MVRIRVVWITWHFHFFNLWWVNLTRNRMRYLFNKSRFCIGRLLLWILSNERVLLNVVRLLTLLLGLLPVKWHPLINLLHLRILYIQRLFGVNRLSPHMFQRRLLMSFRRLHLGLHLRGHLRLHLRLQLRMQLWRHLRLHLRRHVWLHVWLHLRMHLLRFL